MCIRDRNFTVCYRSCSTVPDHGMRNLPVRVVNVTDWLIISSSNVTDWLIISSTHCKRTVNSDNIFEVSQHPLK